MLPEGTGGRLEAGLDVFELTSADVEPGTEPRPLRVEELLTLARRQRTHDVEQFLRLVEVVHPQGGLEGGHEGLLDPF